MNLSPRPTRYIKNRGISRFFTRHGLEIRAKWGDKAALEQLQLINELNEEEKGILLKLIETFVSKKRFKDYLQKNIAAL